MRHCGLRPSYKENGLSRSVTSAREADDERVKRLQIRSPKERKGKRKIVLQCLIGVLLRIAVM